MQRLPRIEVRPQGAAAWRALRARPHWLAAIGAVALAYAALVAWAMWNLPLDRALAPLPEPAIVLLDAEGQPFARRGRSHPSRMQDSPLLLSALRGSASPGCPVRAARP